MICETKPFGTTKDGQAVTAYQLVNSNGMKAVILNYGCILQSLFVPDRSGRLVDVVLGYNTIQEYEENNGYLGAFIGRVGNRIGRGEFELGGTLYHVATNDRGNHLHGGINGFNKKMYDAQINGDELVFSRISTDGEEGYPGKLLSTVRYRLGDDNDLHISYSAISDKDTLFNPTNHSYFNLSGGGTVLGHELSICADHFCEADENCLPTGRLIPVDGTPFDFREAKSVGLDILADDEQLRRGNGYDHNFCLSDTADFKRVACLYAKDTGIEMCCSSNMPGVQLYTANGLTTRPGKVRELGRRDALCLETQFWPDAIHHPDFPSAVLRAGVNFVSQTVYRFTIR